MIEAYLTTEHSTFDSSVQSWCTKAKTQFFPENCEVGGMWIHVEHTQAAGHLLFEYFVYFVDHKTFTLHSLNTG